MEAMLFAFFVNVRAWFGLGRGRGGDSCAEWTPWVDCRGIVSYRLRFVVSQVSEARPPSTSLRAGFRLCCAALRMTAVFDGSILRGPGASAGRSPFSRRRAGVLATFDRKLVGAARAAGVQVFGDAA